MYIKCFKICFMLFKGISIMCMFLMFNLLKLLIKKIVIILVVGILENVVIFFCSNIKRGFNNWSMLVVSFMLVEKVVDIIDIFLLDMY